MIYFDFHNSSDFTPYFGAGLGLAFVHQHFEGVGNELYFNNTNFAWQVGAGVAYALNETVSVDLGYRFISYGTSRMETVGLETSAYGSGHEFALGLRFNF